MTRSIRHEFNTDLASLLLEDIQLQKQQYYYFLGKTDVWGVQDVAPQTEIPMSNSEDVSIRNDMLFLKKIGKNDVSLAAKRYDYKIDTIIPQWDHTIDMKNVGYYVLTSSNRVYACLDNSENSISTVEPTGESFYAFRTADGYLWKYLYTIPQFKRKNFTQINYIPVQNALSDSFYNFGAVDTVVINNGGSGYTSNQLTSITVTGTTTGSGATISGITVGLLGDITSVTIGSGGSGYTSGCDINITSAVGIGAVLTPVIVGGVITSIDITEPGIGYSVSDTIEITVGGAELLPVISHITGSILSVKILKSAAGYVSAPTLTVDFISGSPDGFYPENNSAILEAIISEGRLVDVLIRDPGKLYPADTSTQIIVAGDGEGAAYTPIISGGEIVGVATDNAGQNYNTIVLKVIGTGTGAELSGVISESNFTSNQSIVEQNAVDGAIHSIKLVTPGQGYTTNTTVSISGDGTGCTAHAIIAGDAILKIVVDNPGLGYSYANVSITDPTRLDLGGTLIEAEAYAILPPIGGHGKDSVTQTFASTVVIATSLRAEEQITVLDQEFRKFGIIKDPKTVQTGKYFKLNKDLITYKVSFTSTLDLVKDEILVGTQTEYRVIHVDTNTDLVYLQPTNLKYISPVGSLSAKNDMMRIYNCESVLIDPIVDKYTGRVLYSSNENPFAFNANQGIVIRTFLEL